MPGDLRNARVGVQHTKGPEAAALTAGLSSAGAQVTVFAEAPPQGLDVLVGTAVSAGGDTLAVDFRDAHTQELEAAFLLQNTVTQSERIHEQVRPPGWALTRTGFRTTRPGAWRA